jgi:hypothetical protein
MNFRLSAYCAATVAQRDFNTGFFGKAVNPGFHQVFMLGVIHHNAVAIAPADVFLTENSPSMVLVDNAKLFAPLDAATLNQVYRRRCAA